MVESNCQRQKLLPSEKAFAYKMKLDAEKIKLLPATEISYLGEEAQRDLCDVIEVCMAFPSHGQTRRLRRLYESGELTYEKTLQILEEEIGNQKPKYRLSAPRSHLQ